ncbi:MAG: DUF2071 domain-containing protein [Planctomycetes bacterium]|nr:DUF2071 domain-containing protein [Planctomycetota bacterium]
MTASLEIDRLAPRFRPAGSVAGHQFWSDLLFVHWRVPAVELRPLLPPEVTIDEFDGSAWVGLVPFHMSGVRPWWFPAVPGVSDFHETNVRTYVTCRGEPGVWFFSLEAAKSLAVRVARWRWRLRYFFAEMSISRRDSRIEYHSQRLWPPPLPGHTDVAAEIGDWLPHGGPQGEAQPGTLEFFLAERYLLFTELSPARIARGQVHHRPYPLQTATLQRCEQSLLSAAGINVVAPPNHVLFSPGVSVDIFPLRAITM